MNDEQKAPVADDNRGVCKGGGNHDWSVSHGGKNVNLSVLPQGFCDEYMKLRVALYAHAGDEEVLACQVHFAVCQQCRDWIVWLLEHSSPMPDLEDDDENESV